MDKRTITMVLALLALGCLGYAIYRSLPERITTVENGIETVYGDPQHGLILGLLLLAGVCIGGMIYLATRRDTAERQVHQPLRTEVPIVQNPGAQSSYRPLS